MEFAIGIAERRCIRTGFFDRNEKSPDNETCPSIDYPLWGLNANVRCREMAEPIVRRFSFDGERDYSMGISRCQYKNHPVVFYVGAVGLLGDNRKLQRIVPGEL